MTVRINKQKINLREKLTEFEDKVNFDEVVRGLGEYDGNVGIGTTSPDYKFQVKNNGASNSYAFQVLGGNTDGNRIAGIMDIYVASTGRSAGALALHESGSTTSVFLSAYPNQDSYINNGGNVGIGTTDPGDKKLYVDGPIRSTSSINYEDKEILLPGVSQAVAELFVIEADSHYMVTVTRGDTPSQLTICMVTTDTSPSGVVADVHIHEITNSGHYSIIYETANQSIRWRNDTASNPPKINASVLKLK